jgi:hypothetical protein
MPLPQTSTGANTLASTPPSLAVKLGPLVVVHMASPEPSRPTPLPHAVIGALAPIAVGSPDSSPRCSAVRLSPVLLAVVVGERPDVVEHPALALPTALPHAVIGALAPIAVGSPDSSPRCSAVRLPPVLLAVAAGAEAVGAGMQPELA